MIDFRTKSTEQLKKFLDNIDIEHPTFIRQSQIYVNLFAHGLSIFDYKNNISNREIEQWQPLIYWLEK
jgi:chromosome partitioning protein